MAPTTSDSASSFHARPPKKRWSHQSSSRSESSNECIDGKAMDVAVRMSSSFERSISSSSSSSLRMQSSGRPLNIVVVLVCGCCSWWCGKGNKSNAPKRPCSRCHRADIQAVLYLVLFVVAVEATLRRWESLVNHQDLLLPYNDFSSATLTSLSLQPRPSIETPMVTAPNGSSAGDSRSMGTMPTVSPAITSRHTKQESTAWPHKVLHWDGYDAMNELIGSYYANEHVICDRIYREREAYRNSSNEAVSATSNNSTVDSAEAAIGQELAIAINITFNCAKLFAWSGYGSGNFISFFYGLRLMAQVHSNIGLSILCDDAEATKQDLVLPWLTGWFPPRRPTRPNPFDMVSPEQSCSAYQWSPIAHMYKEIQYDFRRMAIGLVGIPQSENHPARAFARLHLNKPDTAKVRTLVPTMQLAVDANRPVFEVLSSSTPSPFVQQLDDVVIHWRCGDLMDSTHPHFAFVPFATYTQHISPEATSIGIITQPFGYNVTKSSNSGAATKAESQEMTTTLQLGQSRWIDRGNVVQDRCRSVVTALVQYIQAAHPRSTVTVHNGPGETTALAYARLVMANQTIAGISTFGVFPALSTFGTGYLHRPADGPFPNYWMLHPQRIDSLLDNVHILDDTDYMMVADMKQLWESEGETAVLAWFQGEQYEAGPSFVSNISQSDTSR